MVYVCMHACSMVCVCVCGLSVYVICMHMCVEVCGSELEMLKT